MKRPVVHTLFRAASVAAVLAYGAGAPKADGNSVKWLNGSNISCSTNNKIGAQKTDNILYVVENDSGDWTKGDWTMKFGGVSRQDLDALEYVANFVAGNPNMGDEELQERLEKNVPNWSKIREMLRTVQNIIAFCKDRIARIDSSNTTLDDLPAFDINIPLPANNLPHRREGALRPNPSPAAASAR
jgi:hypothetical protein